MWIVLVMAASSSLLDLTIIFLPLFLSLFDRSWAITGRVDGTVSIKEGEPTGTYVYRLQPGSPSYDLTNKMQFYLLTYRQYFSLDPNTGVLKTNRVIDLEDPQLCTDNPKCCPVSNNQPCLFVITASVRSGATDLLTLHVIVNDVNDNAPTFPMRSVRLSFFEGHDAVGTRRSLPLAVDHDHTLDFRRLRYRLDPPVHSHFTLVESRGKDGIQAIYLQLSAPLNAEDGLTQILYLIAEDRRGLNDTLLVNISVMDRNEFAPVFQPGLQREFSVSEREKPGFVITTLVATDADAPPNNKIKYQLLPSSPAYVKEKISVDPVNGTVSLRQRLDYEQQRRVTFGVIAVDHGAGNEEKSAQIILTITVIDWNDNAPHIAVDRGGSAISVRENKGKFERIATIFVEDKDAGAAGNVDCKVITHSDTFSVQVIQGSVYALEARERLDREHVAQYNVTVECTDKGREPKSSKKVIVVNVEDENDNFPSFDRNLYSFWVWENATKGTPLTATHSLLPNRVVVTDPDIKGRPSLFLEDLNTRRSDPSEADAFAILSNGTIVTDRLLDSEVHQSYNFRVCATDGKYRQCEEVIVDVRDVNDHRPRFERSEYLLNIPENSPIHGEVAIFNVTDADIGNQGFKFRLRAPESAASKYFHLKDNRLMLSQSLDREKVVHLTFFVVVEDSQVAGVSNFTSQAKVLVTVLDRNDNPPFFRRPNASAYTFNVSYHEPVGAQVIRLWADDPDDGENGTVFYKIVYTKPYAAQELFGIDAEDYLFVCSDTLSSFAGERIEMMIRATDRGPTPKESNQEMIIRLMDIPPYFQKNTVERRNLLILILGASTLFFLLLLIGWAIHCYRTRNTRRRIMHPQRHKVNYNEEQPLGSLRRYSLDLNNELIYQSSKMYYGVDGISADIPVPGSPNDFYTKKLLSVERASTIDERMSHDSGRGCSIDQDNGSVRKLVSEPRYASILSGSRQTPPILTTVAAPMTPMTTMTPVTSTMATSTTPRSASALAKIPNFCTPPSQRRNTVDNGIAVTADTLPPRMDIPSKPAMCTPTEVWTGGSPNGTTVGKPVKNPQQFWTHDVSTVKLGEANSIQHRV